ncbi:MAG TPA: hypothetical protein VF077_00495 [Nitrospiraceae bacterium]
MAEQTMTRDEVMDLRAKILAGEEVSQDQLSRAIDFLRVSRAAAPAAKEPKAPKVPKTKASLDDLVKKLGDLQL